MIARRDPFLAAFLLYIVDRIDKMCAINSALQVDMTGQVCAESLGFHIYSGFGGQLDFIRGAARSKGGKPIIALPATAKGDTISRIVPSLEVGADVVATRAHVYYIATEFGAAGSCLRRRTRTDTRGIDTAPELTNTPEDQPRNA